VEVGRELWEVLRKFFGAGSAQLAYGVRIDADAKQMGECESDFF
jgi:hypothetical protein